MVTFDRTAISIALVGAMLGCSEEAAQLPAMQGATETHTVAVVGLPQSVADRLVEHLARGKRFVPTERDALRNAIEEQRFGKRDKEDWVEKTLAKAVRDMDAIEGETVRAVGALAGAKDVLNDLADLGTAVGADYLFLGHLERLNQERRETTVPYSREGRSITALTSEARLRLRVVHVKSATVVGATSLHSFLTESAYGGSELNTDDLGFLDYLCTEAAQALLDITFPPRIASTEPLTVSRGANDGAAIGDRYQVRRRGEEIKDAGGTTIGHLWSDLGEVKLTQIEENYSLAEPLTGSGFSVGDRARTLARAEPETAQATSAGGTAFAQGTSQLPRVAMGLVKSGATGLSDARSLAEFTDTIISRLSMTKRFQMIDRQEVDQLLREQEAQALAENRAMPSAMGALEGADYLVYGSISLFGVEPETLQLPGSSRTIQRTVGRVAGNMRVVDARSGDVLVSRAIAVTKTIDGNAPDQRVKMELANAFSETAVAVLLDAIHPIKIATVGEDGTVYVNRGLDGGLSTGVTLQALRPGRPVIDPDTGIQLGVEETPVAEVEIIAVESARSRGRVVPGGSVASGDILRRITGAAETQEGASGPRQIGRGKKPALALGLVRFGAGGRVEGVGEVHARRITDELITKLSNSARFTVLDRQEVDQILDEKAFQAVAGGGDIQTYLKRLAGADYLVHGELSDFYVQTERHVVPILEEVEVRRRGRASGMLRIVDVSSGAIVGADKVEVEMPLSHSGGDDVAVASLIDRFTDLAVAQLVERLYPVRIIGVASDNSVYLNRGEDGDLKVGRILDIMHPEAEMIDPDTGISFGTAEIKVASVEIVAVEPSRSRARVITGSTPTVGDVARAPAPERKAVSKKQRAFEPDF